MGRISFCVNNKGHLIPIDTSSTDFILYLFNYFRIKSNTLQVVRRRYLIVLLMNRNFQPMHVICISYMYVFDIHSLSITYAGL